MASALHIVHIVTRNQPGGSARNLYAQIQWELMHGCEVELVVGGREEGVATPPGATVHRAKDLVRKPNPLDDVQAARYLWRFIRERRPAIVHTHQSKAGVLGRVAARDSGAVLAHTVHMASFGPGYSAPLSWAFQRAERHCARFTDFLITVGEELRCRYLSAGIGREDQYSVVRSPVGVEPFLETRALSSDDRLSLRRRLGLPLRGSVLIAAGLPFYWLLRRSSRNDSALRHRRG